MKLYELTYLTPTNISGEELKILQEKINSLIKEKGGILEGIKGKPQMEERESFIKRKLGYLIKNKVRIESTNEGYLFTLGFYFDPEKLKGLEKEFKSETQILRYMILSKKPLEMVKEKISITGRIDLKPKRAKPLVEIEKPKKVELKEIEKKLEEILGE